MANDVWFVIARPEDGAVVHVAWVGMRKTVERAHAVLRRPADHARLGEESWALAPGEAAAIAEAHQGGVDPAAVADLVVRWPDDVFWWALFRGF